MPAKSKRQTKRRWYTIALLTREGAPMPGKAQFEKWYNSKDVLLDTCKRIMQDERFHRGAYVMAAWPGELSEWEAIHGETKPVFYVYQGGSVEYIKS